MAIRLITGVPGAGKSFYGVSQIVKEYCVPFGDTFDLKPNIILISNIDGLNLDHYELADLIKKAGSVQKFFTCDWQKKICDKFQGKSVVYAIDECQRFFDRKFYDRGVFEFFELHRHYGIDIFLFCHTPAKLCKDIRDLVELEVRAQNRTLALGGFNYSTRCEDQTIGREVLRPDKKIFALYKSMDQVESLQVKKPYLKYAGYLAACILAFVLLFHFSLSTWFKGDVRAETEIETKVTKIVSPTTEVVSKVVSPGVEKSYLKRVSYCRKGQAVFVFDEERNQFVSRSAFPYPLIVDLTGGTLTFFARIPESDGVRSASAENAGAGTHFKAKAE